MLNIKLSTALAVTLLSSSLFGCNGPEPLTYTGYAKEADKTGFDFFKQQKNIMQNGENADCDMLLSKKVRVSFLFSDYDDLDVLDFIAYDGFNFNKCENIKERIDAHCKSNFAYAAQYYIGDYRNYALENKFHKICSAMVSQYGDEYLIAKRDTGGYSVSISSSASSVVKTIKSSEINSLELKKSSAYSGVHYLDIDVGKEVIRLMFGSSSLAHDAHQDFINIM